MRIRRKPNKPKRKDHIKQDLGLGYYDMVDTTLQQFIDAIPEGIDFSDVFLEDDSYYDEHNIRIYHIRRETDEEFQKRMDKYEVALQRYNKWYAENKEAVENELARRDKSKNDKISKQLENAKKLVAKLENQYKERVL